MNDAPVALITGASSGFGREAAKALVECGWRVFGTSRHREAHEVEGFRLLELDVREDESVGRCLDECLSETGGRLDVLVNNAGHVLSGFAEETSIEEARGIFETNFFGVVRVTNAVLAVMRRQRSGGLPNRCSRCFRGLAACRSSRRGTSG